MCIILVICYFYLTFHYHKMIMEVMKDTLKSKFTIEVAWDKTIDIL